MPWRGRWDTELGGVLRHARDPSARHADLSDGAGGLGVLPRRRRASIRSRSRTARRSLEMAIRRAGDAVGDTRLAEARSAGCASASSTSRSRARSSPTRRATIPGRSSRSSPEAEAKIEAALRGWKPVVPSRFEGLMAAYHAALETGGPLPVTLADARALARTHHRADDLGRGGAAFDPADRGGPREIQRLASADTCRLVAANANCLVKFLCLRKISPRLAQNRNWRGAFFSLTSTPSCERPRSFARSLCVTRGHP